tara:strand:+ start:796 stop:966 length:171 start_codon:yes stop_codon:yes gene_type:complete
MSSKLIGIVGETGTGKSTAVKHLTLKRLTLLTLQRKSYPSKVLRNFTMQRKKTTKR